MEGAASAGDGDPRDAERLARSLAEAALSAPSVHNTQPWWFGFRGPRISVHADADRRLTVSDPDGREMMVSCGAALYTLRLSVRARGYRPHVHELPDADKPNLIADVIIGERTASTGEVRRMHEQISLRHTHRGAFHDDPLPESLLRGLAEAAHTEGANLLVFTDEGARTAFAALTEAAELIQRRDPAYANELARWSFAPGSRRPEGIHPTSYPREPQRTEPHFAMRDFARGHEWGVSTEESAQATGAAAVTGTVAVLTTREDRRGDWLHAGQALQRILLHAGTAGFSAAFHTQALQVPELRELIANRFCAGERPQMVLRLGVADAGTASPRRSPDDAVQSMDWT